MRIYPKEPLVVIPDPSVGAVPCLRLELYGCSAPGKQLTVICLDQLRLFRPQLRINARTYTQGPHSARVSGRNSLSQAQKAEFRVEIN